MESESGKLTREELGIPGVREQEAIRRELLSKRLKQLLPAAMRANNIDMWIILDREFNPDPLRLDVTGSAGYGPGSGVRTAYIFYDRGEGEIEKIAISSHLLGAIVEQVYDQVMCRGYTLEGLRPDLKEVVEKRDPRRIGVNTSPTLPMADGLTVELKNYLVESIAPTYAERLVSAELLARDFRANHIEDEIPTYRKLCEWTAAWEEEALSDRVIEVGKSTAKDVHWWMREKAWELLGQDPWNGVRIRRSGLNFPDNADEVIQPGDIVTIDAGLQYAGYATDMKRSVYVLRSGEDGLPEPIRRGWANAMEAREIHEQKMRPGATGTEVYQEITDWYEEKGYEILHALGGVPTPTYSVPAMGIYTHSIGYAVHGIGPRIAEPWPMAFGDRVYYPLGLGHWYAMEWQVLTPTEEYGGRALNISCEEQLILRGEGVVEYLIPPQDEPLLLRS
jgi:Xaa-Pro aminopeptidase